MTSQCCSVGREARHARGKPSHRSCWRVVLVHCSIFHQLAVVEDTVGKELSACLKIEAQLHAPCIKPRRDRAGLTARTVIQHIIELEEIASAPCAYFVVQR